MSLLGSWTICHQNRWHTVSGDELDLEDMVASIQVNLLLPFCHVVCIFAEDLGGNQACASYIRHLIARNSGSVETQARPDLLVIIEVSNDLDALVQLECNEGFPCVFESLQVLTVPIVVGRSTQKIQATLTCMMSDARRLRRQKLLLFTASHLADVFRTAVSQDPTTTSDLLSARHYTLNSLPPEQISSHLQHFLSLCSASATSTSIDSIIELLASALLVHCCPPTTHRE